MNAHLRTVNKMCQMTYTFSCSYVALLCSCKLINRPKITQKAEVSLKSTTCCSCSSIVSNTSKGHIFIAVPNGSKLGGMNWSNGNHGKHLFSQCLFKVLIVAFVTFQNSTVARNPATAMIFHVYKDVRGSPM